MEIKSIELTTAEGTKRNVKVCNAIRSQMFDHVHQVLADAGLDVTVAANGDIAIRTCTDSTTGDTYFTRLSVSFSAKPLDAKIERKAKPKTENEPEIPSLF